MFFTNYFWLPLRDENFEYSFCPAFMESLTDSEALFRNRFWLQGAAFDPGHGMEKKRRTRNYGAAFGTIFQISKCFQRSKQNPYISFKFFTRQPNKEPSLQKPK
jgi:hypothetical protein